MLACFDPEADGDSYSLDANPEHVYFAVSNLEGIYERVNTTGCPVDERIETRP